MSLASRTNEAPFSPLLPPSPEFRKLGSFPLFVSYSSLRFYFYFWLFICDKARMNMVPTNPRKHQIPGVGVTSSCGHVTWVLFMVESSLQPLLYFKSVLGMVSTAIIPVLRSSRPASALWWIPGWTTWDPSRLHPRKKKFKGSNLSIKVWYYRSLVTYPTHI